MASPNPADEIMRLQRKVEGCSEAIAKAYNLLQEEQRVARNRTPGPSQPMSTQGYSRAYTPHLPFGSKPTSQSTSQEQVSRKFSWNTGRLVSSGKRKPSASIPKRSKKKKLKTWTHTFVCLASTSQR